MSAFAETRLGANPKIANFANVEQTRKARDAKKLRLCFISSKSMAFRLLKKGKFIFSSAFRKVLEVHTSTPSKTRSFCVNFILNPRAKITAGAHRFCNENSHS